jgi:Ca2+-binding RTX toxin-like protein
MRAKRGSAQESTNGEDQLIGGNLIIGTSGIDMILGFTGNDTLSGGPGPD